MLSPSNLTNFNFLSIKYIVFILFFLIHFKFHLLIFILKFIILLHQINYKFCLIFLLLNFIVLGKYRYDIYPFYLNLFVFAIVNVKFDY